MKQVSLFDFCKRHNSKLENYGAAILSEDGTPISFNDQASIITHYLHSKDSSRTINYAEQAERLIALWNRIILEEYGQPIVFRP